MAKKVISGILAIIMLFALVGCKGEDLSGRVKELEATVDRQAETITELQENLGGHIGR